MENVLAVLNLGDFAQAFSKMGMFPVFDVAYYIVSILYLKYEPGSVEVSRRSPVASWLCAMLYCFGSYILADIMLGSSPLDYFQYNSHILLASAVWYLIFYCPLNLFYKCVAFLPVKLVLVALKEVVRTRKIAAGVHHAHHAYHHGYFIMVVVGYVKGSGVALISNFEQLLRGVWRPETNEILNMSFPTKASLYGAILFTLQESHWLPVSKSVLILVFTLFMATAKVKPSPETRTSYYVRSEASRVAKDYSPVRVALLQHTFTKVKVKSSHTRQKTQTHQLNTSQNWNYPVRDVSGIHLFHFV
ncbi:trimeric intracellular cation channel type A [Poecilia reticulata]|uniref:Trimeric intracellular cation channel type A n=1 Tax=Poecilia reticulata TaxID=8081 RepID=A0A3P9MTQ2_POERE|nr:PREDICTED: trimeric intracellular cation channel type A [Poecilia reticulata]